MVEREGFSFYVDIVYEWLSAYCHNCATIGHAIGQFKWLHNNQKASREVAKKQKVVNKTSEKLQDIEKGKTSSSNDAQQPIVLQSTGCSKIVVDEDPLLSNMIMSKEIVTGTLSMQLVQVGDSLAYDSHTIEKHNRDQPFPDLRITGPWCDVVTDLDYCQDSTTSDLEHDFGYDRRQLSIVAPPIPAAVQKNMDFLRQSWDNMAKVDVSNQQFQMVVSKKKKKHQKQQAEASKGTFPTRLKVSTSKGFQ